MRFLSIIQKTQLSLSELSCVGSKTHLFNELTFIVNNIYLFHRPAIKVTTFSILGAHEILINYTKNTAFPQ